MVKSKQAIEIEIIPAFVPFGLYKKRFKFAHGGRGSGKSTQIAMLLLDLGRHSKLRILCTREIQKSIKDSVHTLLSDIIQKYNFADYEIQSTTIINRVTGTEFIFAGLREQNINSIKSYEGIDYCWIEEAHTVSQKSLDILIPTIRKETSEIWFTYNRYSVIDPVHLLFNRECGTNFKNKIFNDKYKWVEYITGNAIGIYINYDGNPWFPEVLRIEMEKDKAENFNLYLFKWLGNPLQNNTDTLISLECVNQSVNLVVKESADIISIGVDPARYGDDESVICIRKGFEVLPLITFKGMNTSRQSAEILKLVREFYMINQNIITIKVDDTGIGGGVTDQLDQAKDIESHNDNKEFNINVLPVMNNEIATNSNYKNLGTQLWGELRQSLKTIKLPNDIELINQLTTRKYHIEPDGKINLEKKDTMKKRGLHSPDRADALALCLYNVNQSGFFDTDLKNKNEFSGFLNKNF